MVTGGLDSEQISDHLRHRIGAKRSKRKKLLGKLRAVDASGANWQDVETLALRYGFIQNRVHGSHHIYVLIDEDGNPHTFSIPVHGTKVKPIYILNLVKLIDKLFPEG